MFGRRKKQDDAATVQHLPKPGGKNRPTPTRREREAANRRPLVPSDRKAAIKSAREQARAERMRTRQALVTGDEKNLPERDKGPVKKFVRDYVDARVNAGEFFLLVALVVVVVTFFQNPEAQLLSTFLLWMTVIFCLLDGYLLSRQLKKRITARFGEAALADKPVRYGVLRAFQIRRTRLPKPQVRRGQFPG